MTEALAVASLVATAVLVGAEISRAAPREARHAPVVRAVSKAAASGAFVAAAIVGGGWATAPGRAIVVALALSMAGDLFLLSRERRWFLAGLVAFLLGHVGYAVAFVILGVSPVGVAVAAAPLAVAGVVVWRWLAGRVGKLAGPVVAYVVVICAMVALAAGAVVADPDRVGLLGAALLFWASDLCVARDRFVAPGPANRIVGLPLYYVAQVLFAVLAGRYGAP